MTCLSDHWKSSWSVEEKATMDDILKKVQAKCKWADFYMKECNNYSVSAFKEALHEVSFIGQGVSVLSNITSPSHNDRGIGCQRWAAFVVLTANGHTIIDGNNCKMSPQIGDIVVLNVYQSHEMTVDADLCYPESNPGHKLADLANRHMFTALMFEFNTKTIPSRDMVVAFVQSELLRVKGN